MPLAATSVTIGAATVEIGDYVAAGGNQATMVDVGHLKAPVTLTASYEDYEIKSERAYGAIKRIPVNATVTLKVPMSQSDTENLRIGFRQPTTAKTGTTPNWILAVSDAAEQYHQIKISLPAGGGTGTNKTRTIVIYKAMVTGLAEIPMGKTVEAAVEVTFNCLYDDTVITAGKGKILTITES